MKEKGQVVVLLLLVMVVALAIGLSVINRSILEVSTSRKSEDSSRAFSAAEAGIEQIIQANINNLGGSPVNVGTIDLGNQASANVVIPTEGLPFTNTALAYPPFGKESFAQFWLVNPDNINVAFYNQASFDIYFGDPDTNKYTCSTCKPEDQPAIEVSVIYWDGTKYQTFQKYYDSYKNLTFSQQPRSGFSSCDIQPPAPINTNNNTNASYYCKVSVMGYPYTGGNIPIMTRVRLLYTNISHPVAFLPVGGSLPKQANIYRSSGTSGDVRRTLEVTNYKQTMPQIFDYVLFSARDLNKNL